MLSAQGRHRRPLARLLRRPRAGLGAGPLHISSAAAAGNPAAKPGVLASGFGSSVPRLSSFVLLARGRCDVRGPPRFPFLVAAASSPRVPPSPAGHGGHVPPGFHLEYLLRRLRLPGGLPRRSSQLPAGTCPLPRRQRQEGLRRVGWGAHRHRPGQRRLPG